MLQIKIKVVLVVQDFHFDLLNSFTMKLKQKGNDKKERNMNLTEMKRLKGI